MFWNIRNAEGEKICIDATDSKMLGRYVNDSPTKTANTCIKLIEKTEKSSLYYSLSRI